MLKNRYYSKYTTSMLFILTFEMVALCAVAIKELIVGYHPHSLLIVFGLTLFTGIFTLPLFTWLAIKIFPVFVMVDGIRSYNTLGLYKTVKWQEIKSSKIISFFGFKYVLLKPEQGLSVWVPTWLEKNDNFINDVKEQGGNNPFLSLFYERPANKKMFAPR